MELKDRIAVGRWLATNATLSEVLDTPAIGLVGNERFTERAVLVYQWLWAWSCPRFGGLAGVKQERVFAKGGPAALERRYLRVARIIRRLKQDYAGTLAIRSVRCPLCYCENLPADTLGDVQHHKCRSCGLDYHSKGGWIVDAPKVLA